ncbi:MAG: hypothetical protein RL060_123 [Bacteroidota bacterium]
MENKEALLTQLFEEDIYLILKDDVNHVEEKLVAEIKTLPVETPATKVEIVESLTVVNFLGQNKKQILIILANQGTAICTAPNLDFLTKILNAIKLSLDDVALIDESLFDRKKYQLPPFQQLVSFGSASFFTAQSMPIPTAKYLSSKTILHADSIEMVQADVLLKKQLWGALQQMFL